MNIIPLPVEQTPSLFAADHTPSDDELQQQILGEQRDALRAKNAHNYTRAKMLAEAARSNCRSMYSRWLTLYHGRGQHRQNIIMISYVQCTDALCNAIESHELGHTLKLAAQAAAQDDANASHNFQEITAIFHGVTSSQHGRPQLQKMLDPTIWLMVTGLAVPCADALMLEAIAHYEQYHLHANEFDMSLVHMRPTYTLQGWPTTQTGLLQMSTDSDAWSNEQPHYALFIGDKRSDAIDTHRLRVHDMSIKQKQAYNNALRERLSLVSNEFTPTQLAHFVSNCNLQGTDYDKSDRAIILTALQSVLYTQSHTHYLAAKQDLELRNIEQCARNAGLAIQALRLVVHCVCERNPESQAWMPFAEKMFMTKMLSLLNDELGFAQGMQNVAQEAADVGDPVRATLYTGMATVHLDRHDVVLKLVNPMLLVDFQAHVHDDMPHGAPDVIVQFVMSRIEREVGPVSTTVRERVTNENIVQLARHNMLYMQTENLRRWLSHRVDSDRMYDATEGIAEAVLQ